MTVRGGLAAVIAWAVATGPAIGSAAEPDCDSPADAAHAATQDLEAAAKRARPCISFATIPVPPELEVDSAIMARASESPEALAAARAHLAGVRTRIEQALIAAGTDCERLLSVEASLAPYFQTGVSELHSAWAGAHPDDRAGFSDLSDVYIDAKRDPRIGPTVNRLSGEWKGATDPVVWHHCGILRASPIREAASEALTSSRLGQKGLDTVYGIDGITQAMRRNVEDPFTDAMPATIPGMTDRFLFSRDPERVRAFLVWEAADQQYRGQVAAWLGDQEPLPPFATPEVVRLFVGVVPGWHEELSQQIADLEGSLANRITPHLLSTVTSPLSALDADARRDRVAAILAEAHMTILLRFAKAFGEAKGKPMTAEQISDLVNRLDAAGRDYTAKVAGRLAGLPAPPEMVAGSCTPSAPEVVANRRIPGIDPSAELYLAGLAPGMGFEQLPVPKIKVRTAADIDAALAKLDEAGAEIDDKYEGTYAFLDRAMRLVGMPNPYYQPKDSDLTAIKAILRSRMMGAYATYNSHEQALQMPPPDPTDEVRLGAEVHEGFHFLRDQWLRRRGSTITEFHHAEKTSMAFDHPVGNTDEEQARDAIVEGEAMLFQLEYMRLAGQGLLAEKTERGAMLAATGLYSTDDPINQDQSLPYGLGMDFIRAGRPLSEMAGTGKVTTLQLLERLYEHPPVSTEQVLHPEKYFAAEPDVPTPIDADRMTGALPAGWEVVYHDVDGEMGTRQGLATRLMVPRDDPRAEEIGKHIIEAAAGWGGDRAVIARMTDGEPAYVQYFTWDTPQDATEFVAAMKEFDATLPHDRAYTFTDPARPNDVVWIAGPDSATAEQVARALFAANPARH